MGCPRTMQGTVIGAAQVLTQGYKIIPTSTTGRALTTLRQTSVLSLAAYNTGWALLSWLALPAHQTHDVQDVATLLYYHS